MKENEDIEEAIVTVHKMTEDEKMRRLADLREKAIMDEKAIRRKGYEDGRSAGYQDGRSVGYQDGRSAGYQDGRSVGYQDGLEKGMEKGIEKGRSESQKAMAKKLKDIGMSAKDIEKITDIAIEKIEKL